MGRLRLRRPSPALAVALLALAVALSGVSYAAVALPRNSVGTPQLKNGAVTAPKIRTGAVTSAQVRNGTITTFDVRDRSLLADDFARGELPAGAEGPQGPQGPPGPRGDPGTPADTSRLLGRTLTVVATDSVPAGAIDSHTVSCPSGYEAVGGGADADDGTTFVSSSAPLYGTTRVRDTADGQQPAATGWYVRVFNSAAAADTFKIAVVCARIGT